ncbi:MAG: hypothetical protein M3141_08820 [Actinomycetota bacterium]|nr:hypothetical protein [Actinomycetota bacterium]
MPRNRSRANAYDASTPVATVNATEPIVITKLLITWPESPDSHARA